MSALFAAAVCANAEEAKPKKVSFYSDIRPIFQGNCHGCHQPAKARGEYVMTTFAQLLAGGESEDKAIVPGKPDESQLITLITTIDGEAEMPRKGDPLHAEEIALITRWVAEGAVDDTPTSARQRYDVDHPPVYSLPPVISSMVNLPSRARPPKSRIVFSTSAKLI